MANLLARLNTWKSLSKAGAEEKEYGAGIYVDFGDESERYKEGTFKKILDSILEQALVSEEQSYRDIAQLQHLLKPLPYLLRFQCSACSHHFLCHKP